MQIVHTSHTSFGFVKSVNNDRNVPYFHICCLLMQVVNVGLRDKIFGKYPFHVRPVYWSTWSRLNYGKRWVPAFSEILLMGGILVFALLAQSLLIWINARGRQFGKSVLGWQMTPKHLQNSHFRRMSSFIEHFRAPHFYMVLIVKKSIEITVDSFLSIPFFSHLHYFAHAWQNVSAPNRPRILPARTTRNPFCSYVHSFPARCKAKTEKPPILSSFLTYIQITAHERDFGKSCQITAPGAVIWGGGGGGTSEKPDRHNSTE